MSDWTPTDEQVEKAARYGHSFDQQIAMEFGHQTELIPFESLPQWAQDTHRDKARAQLVAVGPHIAAQALRDAAGSHRPACAEGLLQRADTIEQKEAA